MTDRNRTTVRRGLRAGAIVGVVAAAVLALAGGAPAGVALTAFALAAFVAAGWLLLSALLDVIAGAPLDRRRIVWTVTLTLVAMLGPVLLIGALAVRESP